jgi:hypothetical protein
MKGWTKVPVNSPYRHCEAVSGCRRPASVLWMDENGKSVLGGACCAYHKHGGDEFWEGSYCTREGYYEHGTTRMLAFSDDFPTEEAWRNRRHELPRNQTYLDWNCAIPEVRFAVWGGPSDKIVDSASKEGGQGLDFIMRLLRRNRTYAGLYAVIPTVHHWGDEKTPPQFNMEEHRIGWTDGKERFELIHPRIIWGDEFRFIWADDGSRESFRFELATKNPDHPRTQWLGRFV